jgi:hypothetical protein
VAVKVKPIETFRGDFTFRNSAEAILRFPFPFAEDSYMYAVNLEPHAPGPPGSAYEFALDVDEHYLSEVEERRLVLEEDPSRCAVLPHMMTAQWDTLELVMECFARDYPDHFMLTRAGDRWTWENRLLGIRDSFTFGEQSGLPLDPFEYIMRQAQGDFTLQDQREGTLFMDGGMVTCQADWSLAFDLGMNFIEWHGPVPLAHEMGVFERALRFLMNLRLGEPVRRLNWTMTIHPRMDTSPENYHKWGPDRMKVTPENAGQFAHLRVELQAFFRLPRSNAILFSIRCYLISLAELTTVPRWAMRTHRVLKSLPRELINYKGLARYHDTVVDWLSEFDDRRPLEWGTSPV